MVCVFGPICSCLFVLVLVFVLALEAHRQSVGLGLQDCQLLSGELVSDDPKVQVDLSPTLSVDRADMRELLAFRVPYPETGQPLKVLVRKPVAVGG